MNASTQTVIITGASSGIGFALAEEYLKRGYNVVGNARSAERLQAAAAKLGNPARFLLVDGDIAQPATARKLFERAIAAFGRVDILINNAGIFIAKPVGDYSEDDLESIVNTNLKGFFYPSQQAAAHMGARRQGHIVTITASIAMQPNAKVPALLPVLIKGGLNDATRALAIELAPLNVKVSAVAPGIIDTPMHQQDDGTRAFLSTLSPAGHTGATSDVVDAVLYLTSAKFTSGIVLAVDGGASAGTW
ncbi:MULTISPECIES: SDR family NAD(P)-dependent oxidoreductase [unclassified Janthinobacterium]|uniref:SDR family NAD(P)-dependent oxidoreductase n=1 Tax=unclassified Janthinobacterium TaxID=2610881 RepID=UPI000347B206|nr:MULTISPECIES: SDR family NAD(P)-dependent oxidoreductase [unclassified Janthinobacterium]MEC5162663.1 NAD(P)-dependent dehydrogenase (short-subunit alcohol dehydrogenase family) [Janthinobacterium sp. CG_S6]